MVQHVTEPSSISSPPDGPFWPEEYLEFIRLFHAGEYYEAHEVLEDLWVVEVAPLREFYKALIQAAAALYHFERGNPGPGARLWQASRARLAGYPASFEGLRLDRFVHVMDGVSGRCALPSGRPAPILPRPRIEAHDEFLAAAL